MSLHQRTTKNTARGLTILIIDNEPNLITIVQNMLQEHISHSSTNIDQAIQSIEENQYDCILCDIIMPEKGGDSMTSSIVLH